MKVLYFVLSVSFFLFQNIELHACPICTLIMTGSFILGEILSIDVLYIGFLISCIIVSSSDWLIYLYDKKIYFNFLKKIDNFQEIITDKTNKKLVNIVKLKFILSRYILISIFYFINYYLVYKISSKYNINYISLYKGLFLGFLFAFFGIKLSNFLTKHNVKIIRFQKTILLLLSFLIFIFFTKVLYFNVNDYAKYYNINNTKINNLKEEKNLLIIITGASGSGKTTVANLLSEKMHINRIITHTTRQLRPMEKNGIDYFFITKDKFKEMIQNNEFVEYSNHFDNFYGLAKKDINTKDNDLILVVNEKGAFKISQNLDVNYIIIYLDVSSKEMRRRILSRDSKINKKELENRIKAINEDKILNNIKNKKIYKVSTDNLNEQQVFQKVKDIILSTKNAK